MFTSAISFDVPGKVRGVGRMWYGSGKVVSRMSSDELRKEVVKGAE
jgi:hypothetical protein